MLSLAPADQMCGLWPYTDAFPALSVVPPVLAQLSVALHQARHTDRKGQDWPGAAQPSEEAGSVVQRVCYVA